MGHIFKGDLGPMTSVIGSNHVLLKESQYSPYPGGECLETIFGIASITSIPIIIYFRQE